MRNKFLKVTFMALCLSTSSIVHAMIEEGDKGENRHAPVLFDGEYEIDGAAFLEPKYGSVTVCQFDKSILALRVNLNDSPGLWESNDPKVLQPLLKLNESDFPNNFVALHYNAEAVTPGVTSYYGKRTVDNCDILFEFRISDIPWKSHGEKGFNLWVRSILPVVSKIVVIPATEINSWKKTELNFGEDSLHVIPTIQFSLFKKANEQTIAQDSNPGPSSSSSTPAPADEPILRASPTTFQMGKSNPYLTSGFSGFEGSHRWTEGKEASITIPLKSMEPRPTSISFLNTRGLITDHHPQQNLTVKVNGKEHGHYVYNFGDNNHTIDIPLPKDGPATIEFETPNAISPFDLEINADKRALGISFREVQFHY